LESKIRELQENLKVDRSRIDVLEAKVEVVVSENQMLLETLEKAESKIQVKITLIETLEM
jgi:hypothetical protein